ncbi:MAG: helix-turn-helix transcriptional regulator [Bacilli bacterium]
MELANEISKKRKIMNMTQRELADKINVSDKTISRWEKGVAIPDIYSLKKISVVLDIKFNQLFDDMSVEIDDEEKIDHILISKFKNNCAISFLMLMFSFALLLVIKFVPSHGERFVNGLYLAFFIMSILMIGISSILFVTSFIKFRDTYLIKKHKKRYSNKAIIGGMLFVIGLIVNVLIILI